MGDGEVHIVGLAGWDGGDAFGGLIDQQEWNGLILDPGNDGILASD